MSTIRRCHLRLLLAVMLGLPACSGDKKADEAASAKDDADDSLTMVGYDLRRLRPRDGEPLAEMFERARKQALADGKQVAVLFSADWCEPCRTLDLELGSMHPAELIGHIRILQLKEEDWKAAARLDEFRSLRRKWRGVLDAYPAFIVLDENGGQLEEMNEALERFEDMGIDPTLPRWLESVKKEEGAR